MLSTTYVLTTVYIEQRHARNKTLALRADVSSHLADNTDSDFSDMSDLLSMLISFDAYYRARKIDTHVRPALLLGTDTQASLLGKLARLKDRAACSLRAACEQMDTHLDEVSADDVLLSMRLYCELVMEALDTESEELLSLLPALLEDEDWFSIAAHLSRTEKGRIHVPRPLPLRPHMPLPTFRLRAEARAA